MVEALEHAEHKPQIAADEFLTCGDVAAVHKGKELAHALIGDYGKRGCIHAADFNFTDCHHFASSVEDTGIMTAENGKYSPAAASYFVQRRI